MSSKVCRLCRAVVAANRAVQLFSNAGLAKQWPSRITALLGIPVEKDDGISPLICDACKTRVHSLEKAAADLTAFKEMARCSSGVLGPRGPLKRTKATSGDVGVSPDTIKERPRSKLSRTRLNFDNPSALVPRQSVSLQHQHRAPTPSIATSPLRLSQIAALNPSNPPNPSKPPRPTATVTLSTPSRTLRKDVGDAEAEVTRSLLSGNTASIANGILAMEEVREAVFMHFLDAIDHECTTLCRKLAPTHFRTVPMENVQQFNWQPFVDDLECCSPLLFRALTRIAGYSDRRNKGKVGPAHFPGICTAVAVILKERNREMCGLQSVVSLLMYTCHCEKQVFVRLNHLNLCASYPATLRLVEAISKLHTVPLKKWIEDGQVLKFWGDNVDKKRKVWDLRSDHQGKMMHMFSMLVGRSRTPAPELPRAGSGCNLALVPPEFFLPSSHDIAQVKSNLVTLVSRVLVQYFPTLAPFARLVPKHIQHQYSQQMSQRSEVFVLDILMKNEAKHQDMLDIMEEYHKYLEESGCVDRVLSGGDQLTCERQVGSQRQTMCGEFQRERLSVLEPVVEDWHCLVAFLGVIWKHLYRLSSRECGTLAFFRTHINRIAVSKDPKKEVNACIDFLNAIIKGHWLACACEELSIDGLSSTIRLPAGSATDFIQQLAEKIVNRCTIVETAFTHSDTANTDDTAYNYARVLCHYGSLASEFRDAWAEGDGERVVRCWKLFMPHFQASGSHKYCLEALRLQFQVSVVLSPNLAHQVMWHRFVNVKGGEGRNIPCDLFNEHVNKQLKVIIANMGPNLTEVAMQRAARSVSTLHTLCEKFDKTTALPHHSTAHSTRSDIEDIKKVTDVVLECNLLKPTAGRCHPKFRDLDLNPLKKWNKHKMTTWIKGKQKHYLKFQGSYRGEGNQSDSEASD